MHFNLTSSTLFLKSQPRNYSRPGYARPMVTSSPKPHVSWSLRDPWISSSSAGVKLMSFSWTLPPSLGRRLRFVSRDGFLRSCGALLLLWPPRPGHLNRADLDELERTDNESVSSLSCSLLDWEWLGSDAVVPAEVDSVEASGSAADWAFWRGGSAGGEGDEGDVASGDETASSGTSSSPSTSSASRYHLRRRVQRPQPSWPRRPLFHCQGNMSSRHWVSGHTERHTLLS